MRPEAEHPGHPWSTPAGCKGVELQDSTHAMLRLLVLADNPEAPLWGWGVQVWPRDMCKPLPCRYLGDTVSPYLLRTDHP